MAATISTHLVSLPLSFKHTPSSKLSIKDKQPINAFMAHMKLKKPKLNEPPLIDMSDQKILQL